MSNDNPKTPKEQAFDKMALLAKAIQESDKGRVLTQEDLQKIKLPLSDDDYVRLREEELMTNGEVWKLASKELRDSYETLMVKYYDQYYGSNDAECWDIVEPNKWFPPQTQKYKNYPDYRCINKCQYLRKAALTKENLEAIKRPLSDDDYVLLREEELRTNGEVWKIAPEKLLRAFEEKMVQCYRQRDHYEEDDAWVIIDGHIWFPPLTEKYKDYPTSYHDHENYIFWKAALTKEDFAAIKLPLSDEDYLRLQYEEMTRNDYFWDDVPPKTRQAFRNLNMHYFDLMYPNNDLLYDDIEWVLPPSITLENVETIIENPKSRLVAYSYLKRHIEERMRWTQGIAEKPRKTKAMEICEQEQKRHEEILQINEREHQEKLERMRKEQTIIEERERARRMAMGQSEEQIKRDLLHDRIGAFLMEYRSYNLIGAGQMSSEDWIQVYKNAGMTNEEIEAYREENSKNACGFDDPLDDYRASY